MLERSAIYFIIKFINNITPRNKIDLSGFSKNAPIFMPISAKDINIISFPGNNDTKKFLILIFASADAPLIKNEGVNGKQYSKNNIEEFLDLIFFNAELYLL